jgi:hypothetical protein
MCRSRSVHDRVHASRDLCAAKKSWSTKFADHDFQETKLLDEFVEDSVMRWVRLIVARQPDAEFVFIAMKEDALAGNKVTEELFKKCFMAKLKQVNATVQQMKEPKEKDARRNDDSVNLAGWWKKAGTGYSVGGGPAHDGEPEHVHTRCQGPSGRRHN